MNVLIILALALTLTGCGKTLDQLKQAAHSIIDIAGKVYEDATDNTKAVKDAVTPAEQP